MQAVHFPPFQSSGPQFCDRQIEGIPVFSGLPVMLSVDGF